MIADVLTPNKKRAYAFQAGIAILVSVIFASMTFNVFSLSVTFSLAPIIVIFLWPNGADSNISYFSIFVAGLFLDILTGTPMGGWSLIFLPLFALMTLVNSGRENGFTETWMGFSIWMLGLMAFFMFGRFIKVLELNHFGLLKLIVLTVLLFPVVYLLKNKLRDVLVSEDG